MRPGRWRGLLRLEDDDWARKPALVPQPLAALDAVGKSALPEPLLVVVARPVEAPPALEDDDWAREPALVPQPLAALDAVGKSALPEPLLVVAARAVGGPPALEDDDEALERELERLVEDVERMHDTLEPIETKVARELSVPDWLAATIEESMRRAVRDAPQWEPRLADIPRSTETSQFGVVVWRIVLFAEMEELRECGNDRERIERHIANVRERATTDAPWRSQIIATIAGSISPRYLADLGRAGYFEPEPTRDEAEDALLLRWRRQGAGGGLDAWSEQSVARAAGLEVDFSFGQWSRARESGLLAEDVLRLHLHDAVRAARWLKRTFPGESRPGPGGPTTLREWHRGLARVVSDVRERLRAPKTREDLMTDLAMRMVPDLRAEWARGGEGAGRGPTLAERDQALLELTRQRAREAGVDDDLDAPRERGGAGRESSGGARGEQVEALPEPAPRTANAELERRIREEFEEQARRDRAAERKRTEAYGAPAVRLASEFLRLREEHGELRKNFTAKDQSTGTLEFLDRDGNSCYSERASGATVARMDALLAGRPPEDIPELERDITRQMKLELERVRKLAQSGGRDR